MAYYTRYEKLQKCHSDGTPYEPAEYKKGEKFRGTMRKNVSVSAA